MGLEGVSAVRTLLIFKAPRFAADTWGLSPTSKLLHLSPMTQGVDDAFVSAGLTP